MKVLVTDTTIIIDLERAALLHACFGLPIRLAVPDVLYSRELHNHGGAELVALGLEVAELDEVGAAMAQKFSTANAALALSDCFALALAKVDRWALLTANAALRQEAEGLALNCHGFMWLIDHLIQHEAAEACVLRDGLAALADHRHCRWPRTELRRRIDMLAAA